MHGLYEFGNYFTKQINIPETLSTKYNVAIKAFTYYYKSLNFSEIDRRMRLWVVKHPFLKLRQIILVEDKSLQIHRLFHQMNKSWGINRQE